MSKVGNFAQRIRYETVTGFFIQSDGPATPQAHPPAFGLASRTSSTYWKEFEASIKSLQQSAPKGVRYVVCWLARHGQGWHNVCVDKYGIDEWETHWSKLNGNRDMTWGPDAKLTPLGETQAKEVNALWKEELSRPGDPVPLPTKLFSSPLARALATLDLTFKDILPNGEDIDDPRKPLVLEDELWSETVSESDREFGSRMKATLDHIFKDLLEETDTFISITAHSGVAAAILRLVGHPSYPLPGGGVVPVVIRATFQ
ncbi:unnamed protein product [Rhizoctonia solani]|uniref:Phosphomutase PMU1 n=1 Tax=Rhizoctonia solani TaxID=456999 RepID=A0A8H3HLK1_9AGAM|nr:unnamed protein product [Rhizoctonia solani]